MSQTQIASMFLGNPNTRDRDERLKGVSSQLSGQIHIIDGQQDEILDYITARHILDDTHHRSLVDTIETYTFITFADKRFSEFLEKRNRIIIPDEDDTLREFVIFEAAKYKDSEGHKSQVFAHASYLELKKASILHPSTFTGTASQHGGRSLNDSGWQIGIVESSGTRTLTIENHTNPYEFMKRLAREFDLELRFRIEHDGNKVIGRYVDLLERVGEWQGREAEFGKDLDGIRRVEKQDIVTALLGLGPEDTDGNRLEVLVEDEEALQRWGRVDEYGNLHHLIEPYEIQSSRTEMTEQEARQYTRTALDKRIDTQVTYETTIVDLENVPGMENKKIRFGDTIKIKDTKFNPPLYLEARVFEQDRSIKSKAKKDIKLGDYIEHTEEEVNAIWKELQREITRRLARSVIASIVSSAGDVFKDNVSTTTLRAHTFVSGVEVDESGTTYEYRWHKFDKDGHFLDGQGGTGKEFTVSASSIDEKASYTVEIIYEDEVLILNQITIAKVFDGEQGPEGPEGDKGEEGPKGDEGQGVEDITPEYYASNSNSSQTGGAWGDVKPAYHPDKFLWTRDKITYKNPSVTEYTTPVLDDSWEALGNSEEAKQDAQNAMATADGKNTVFRQSNTPSTTNRKIGDLWFNTGQGNRMSVWTGSWTQTRLDYQALNVGKLSAISADLGNVTAGDIKGITLNLANGKFVVDANGNATFKGDVEGARITGGTISGTIITSVSQNEQDSLEISGGSVSLRKNNSSSGALEKTIELNADVFAHNALDSTPFAFQGDYSFNRDVSVAGKVEAEGFMYADAFEIHPSSSGIHVYVRPSSDGEVRVTSAGTTGTYRDARMRDLYLQGGEVHANGNSFFIRSEYVGSLSAYTRTYTVDNNHLRVTGSGVIGMISSSRRFKLVEEPVANLVNPFDILKLEPKSWFDRRSSEDYAHTLSTGEETEVQQIKRTPGLIAEDVEDVGLDLFVTYDEEHKPNGYNKNLWTLLIPIIKEQQKDINKLKKQLKGED